MSALLRIFRLILADQRTALMRGAALGLAVLLAGIALLGLSGWFITAAAAAGLAGMGAVFDVFRPAAMVRFLALGRTAARYGERLLTHDATLRALTSIRVRLLRATASAPHDVLVRLRGPQTLNRLMADVDALDGVPLRLILPITAGLLAQMCAFVVLWWLVDLSVALWISGGFVAGSAVILMCAGRLAAPPSGREEAAAQAFRSRFIDMIRARADLAVYGRLAHQGETVLAIDAKRQRDRVRVNRIERGAGFGLSMTGTIVAAGALGLGMGLAEAGTITPALAAIGFFASLALMETVAPLRRAMADLGRMTVAARRVGENLAAAEGEGFGDARSDRADLRIANVTFRRGNAARPVLDCISLSVAAGESVAITGPSGSGKSTLLLLAARILTPDAGRIYVGSLPLQDWDETRLRKAVMLVPQRSVLMAGTVGDALRLADPAASEDELWRALEAVALAPVIRAKGGLEFRLGPNGSGLSGGEARRLVLARALLRQPKLLMLDEPTEGLDEATALKVLNGLRAYLPEAAILTASHRVTETAWADRVVALDQQPSRGASLTDSLHRSGQNAKPEKAVNS
ncbi:MAG: thiol reductant ABC exporter subunit CydC [Hoeflea sp.]|uniref:thiol reductant ABC exporter subunit CydC n=1 Tax=Hoeflea sp. TaxID=1940281 RepID=UPI001D59C6AF|nr:thiol reductant ABC exporter subunit CydC [Hoeflea sp.]MBU4529686.1 thiol reductant ABC exporter subunit CydC [Alphaproteobacteria bacterium]MBU4546805.1 thiol reductant ABC exporter subunit CydC [Alphaproteobacteria bacterium]MBU4551073.1 thiol reductant ABC exporter subunit CydC [Alphaproteobacteria bacterium]MBV1724015.1 thiol reductant ABC exporter subunit CydC [Hoeflea sp.]MBV1763292.1 thiol reductant ABC exporter subunit CydC [Hoeflea sp.]